MQLSGYSNLKKLSQGGMSTVYLAHQDSLNRTVAIKVLSSALLWDEAAKKFFDQESLVIARLNHPNIIKIIDRGINENGRPYFVMEYIQGKDLKELSNSTQLSINARIQLMLQICRGMSFAHKNGVVHRDIKPSNILIDTEGHAYILDFGIAWLQTSAKPGTEEIVGTPDFMSPEQYSDPGSVSSLSDIYSLGALMYELFSGSLPAQHFNDLASQLSTVPSELSQLILQCLNTAQQERPATAGEVSFALVKALKGKHIKPAVKAEAKAAIGKAAEKFKLLDVINQTGFSAVYLFEDKSRNKQIVVKKRIKSVAGFEQSTTLKTLDHENIIKILGTSKNKTAFIVVMEYLTGGNLQDRLSRKFELVKFLRTSHKICSAMQAAHEKEIFHGDLRPSNILFDKDETLKISDFGFERHYSFDNEQDWYQPEHKTELCVSRDIYSAGVIFYQMLTGELPTIRYGQLKTDKTFNADYPELGEVIKNMIDQQSINHVESFSEARIQIENLLKARPDRSKTQARAKFGWKYFILILIIVNLLLASALYLFNPQIASWFSHFFN